MSLFLNEQVHTQGAKVTVKESHKGHQMILFMHQSLDWFSETNWGSM